MKKNLFAIITMAISIGVLVYFLITTDGITAFAEIAGSIQIPWFISIFAAIIVGWLLEALVLHFFCKKVYPQWKYWHSLIIGMIGLLYSALTPFATGGQAMQIYYMRKLGLDTGGAGSIIAVKSLVYQIIMVLFALVMVFWKLPFFQSSVSNFSFLTIIGLTTNLTFVLLVLFFAINEKATDKCLRAIIKFLYRIKIVKKPVSRYYKLHSEFAIFHKSTKLVGKSVKVYVGAVFFTIVQIFVACIIPYLIYRSFNFEGADVFDMLGAQSFVNMVSAFIPLPGASGGAEGSFYLFFGTFFGNLIMPALFIWRIGTYYLNIVGGIAFIFIVKRIPHRTLYREKTKAELEADRQLKELSSKKLDL